jgi:hypothetical protein
MCECVYPAAGLNAAVSLQSSSAGILKSAKGGTQLDAIKQKLKALDSFKAWSNYLLATTVAALGSTAPADTTFCTDWLKKADIVFFALSVVFAILTLALIPHAAEDIKQDANGAAPSIYHVLLAWMVCRIAANPSVFASAHLLSIRHRSVRDRDHFPTHALLA